jgi:hypothetical protein
LESGEKADNGETPRLIEQREGNGHDTQEDREDREEQDERDLENPEDETAEDRVEVRRRTRHVVESPGRPVPETLQCAVCADLEQWCCDVPDG